jgi:hypothetical protein
MQARNVVERQNQGALELPSEKADLHAGPRSFSSLTGQDSSLITDLISKLIECRSIVDVM